MKGQNKGQKKEPTSDCRLLKQNIQVIYISINSEDGA